MSRKPVSERMERVKAEIEKLKNEEKLLKKEQDAQARKARTHRLCQRGGLVESLLPDLAEFTEEQFNLFVDKALITDYPRRIIAEIKSGKLKPHAAKTSIKPIPNEEKIISNQAETGEQTDITTVPVSANTAESGSTGGNAHGGDNERQDG